MTGYRSNPRPADRLLGCLLWLYPAPFRDEYAAEMGAVLRRRWRDEAGLRGPGGMALFGVAVVWDALCTAFEEHALMLFQDLKFTLRTLARSPLFAAAAILTVALGTGAETAIFSLVDHVLLRPLPFPESDRLLVVRLPHPTEHDVPMSVADFLDWRSQNQIFPSVAAFVDDFTTLIGAGEPVVVPGAYVTDGFFSTLQVHAALGRTFERGDDAPGHPPTVVLSAQLWRSRFHEDRNVIGKVIVLDSKPHTIIGVMEAAFAFPSRRDLLWMIQKIEPPACRCPYFLTGIARIRDGITEEEAIRRLNESIYQGQAGANQAGGKRIQFFVRPLREAMNSSFRTSLLVLMGAVTLVLIIACVNVANLLLARSTAREQEIVLRVSLGANTRRLLRQFLTESLVLATLGAVAGVAFALMALRWYKSAVSAFIPEAASVDLDGRVLMFTVGCVVVSGLFFGVAPALRAVRTQMGDALRGGRGTTRTRWRGRSALIIAEVALAFVLVTGAGLLIRSFARLSAVDSGTRPDHLMTFRLSLPDRSYSAPLAVRRFFARLVDRIGQLPGVEAVGAGSGMPPDQIIFMDEFTFEERPLSPGEGVPVAPIVISTPNYLRALGIPILKGRSFSERDTHDAPPVAIISQTMAERYFPGKNPIGKRIRQGRAERSNPWMEIIGVTADAKYGGLDMDHRPVFYRPLAQASMSDMLVAVRTLVRPDSLTPALRLAVASLDKDLALDHVQTMEQNLAESVSRPRIRTALMTALACLALALAGIGVYGVVAYSVSRRTPELAVRTALGALRSNLVWFVIRQAMKPVLAGLCLGIVGALALGRAVRSLLFGIEPQDPLALAYGVLVLGSVALLACLVPALRATRIDPATALRSE